VRGSSAVDALHHVVDVEHARLDHLLAGERQQLVGQPGGPLGGLLDLPDVVADGRPAPAGQLPGYLFSGEGGVVGDDAEQVVEVVGHPAGELAQAFQSLGLVQLPFQLVPLGLGAQPLPLGGDLQPLGHIPDHGGDQEPFIGAHRSQGHFSGEGGAVAAAPGQLHVGAHGAGTGISDIPGPVGRVQAACLVGDQEFHRLADQLVPPVAEQLLGLGVDQRDPPVGVDAHHRVRRGLQQPGKPVVLKVVHGHHTVSRINYSLSSSHMLAVHATNVMSSA